MVSLAASWVQIFLKLLVLGNSRYPWSAPGRLIWNLAPAPPFTNTLLWHIAHSANDGLVVALLKLVDGNWPSWAYTIVMYCLPVSNQLMAHRLSSNQWTVQITVFQFCQFCQTFNLPTQQNHTMNVVLIYQSSFHWYYLNQLPVRYINSRNEQTVLYKVHHLQMLKRKAINTLRLKRNSHSNKSGTPTNSSSCHIWITPQRFDSGTPQNKLHVTPMSKRAQL